MELVRQTPSDAELTRGNAPGQATVFRSHYIVPILGGDRFQQRTRQQELVAEDVVVNLVPRLAVAVGLDAQ